MGQVLVVRKLAEKEGHTRLRMNVGGEDRLVNPETPGVEHESYPLRGYLLVDAPENVSVGMDWLKKQVAEGWVSTDGEDMVFKPGGPPDNPWAVTHTFTQWDEVTFHCYDGDVTYQVTRNADKDEAGEVLWSLDLEMVEDNRNG